MSWFREPALWVAAVLLPFALACLQDPDTVDHTPVVVDSQYLDWDLTAQWPDIAGVPQISGMQLNADGTRLMVGGSGLTVLDLTKHGELLPYARFEDLNVSLYRSQVTGDQLWTHGVNEEGSLLRLWDISQLDLTGPVLIHEHELGSSIFDFEVTADHVYVGQLNALSIFDRAAMEAGPVTLDDAIGSVALVNAINDYTVTAQGTDWVWLGGLEGKALYDVGDKTAPTYVRSLGDRNEHEVFFVGDLLVSHGRTWDVSDPNNPQWVTFLPFTYGYKALLDPQTVVSSGEGLVFTDFSQSPPVEVRFIPTSAQPTVISNGSAVFLQDASFIYRVEAP